MDILAIWSAYDRGDTGLVLGALHELLEKRSRYWLAGQRCRPQDIDDILQDALLAILRGMANIRRRESLESYAIGAVRHLFYLRYRDHKRLEPLSEAFSAIASPALNPESAAVADEASGHLQKLLDGSRHKTLLIRFAEGEKPPKICHELGITFTQYRLAKSRELARMRNCIRRENNRRNLLSIVR